MAEAWYTFPAQMGEHRAFLTFDHGFSEIAETDSRIFLLKFRVAIKAPNETGLPTNDEFPALKDLDERLDNAITNAGGVYVGRVTVKGYRHFFFYVSFDEESASQLGNKITSETGYPLDIAYEQDPGKEGYWRDLYPTKDDWQVIRDMDVLNALESRGDIADTEREVFHWAYFDGQGTAEIFKNWLAEAGYKINSDHSADDGKWVVQFSHIGKMTLEALTKHTISLNRKIEALHGNYDGWETSVESATV
ncbi:MAG TPA: DUF695 domain-containing protein [Burkholderiaceae bacterium]|jgi:hypothetical protein